MCTCAMCMRVMDGVISVALAQFMIVFGCRSLAHFRSQFYLQFNNLPVKHCNRHTSSKVCIIGWRQRYLTWSMV